MSEQSGGASNHTLLVLIVVERSQDRGNEQKKVSVCAGKGRG